MVASIGPFWDANETWLVLGIGMLLVAFPKAHGVVLTALYLPVVAMLVGLMLRGVAFDFRVKARGWHRDLWNWLFCAGSSSPRSAQGCDARALRQRLRERLRLLAVRACWSARACCGGYVLLGATWLIMKTEGELQRKASRWARWGLLWVALGVALVSLAHAAGERHGAREVVRFPAHVAADVLPARPRRSQAGYGSGHAAHRARQLRPMSGRSSPRSRIFALAFLGLAYSIYPYVVIDRLTIWEAAAHPAALRFLAVGAAMVLPFIAGYTVLSYRISAGRRSPTTTAERYSPSPSCPCPSIHTHAVLLRHGFFSRHAVLLHAVFLSSCHPCPGREQQQRQAQSETAKTAVFIGISRGSAGPQRSGIRHWSAARPPLRSTK